MRKDTCLALVVMLVCCIPVSGQIFDNGIVFDDGQEHVLTEDTDWVVVSHQSRLDLQARVYQMMEIDDATVETNGGSIAGNARLTNEANLIVNDGGLNSSYEGGMSVLDSRVIFNGGNSRVDSIGYGGTSAAVYNEGHHYAEFGVGAGGVATVTVNGGSLSSDEDGGVNLRESATLRVTGGVVSGHVEASDQSVVEMSGGAVSTPFTTIKLSGEARLNATGGTITNYQSESDRPSVVATENSRAAAQDLSFEISDGAGHVLATDNAHVEIASSSGTGTVFSYFFRSEDNARVVIREGHFTSPRLEADKDYAMVTADGNSQISVIGGSYEFGARRAPDVLNVASASEQANVRIASGAFHMTLSEAAVDSSVNGVLATGESRAKVHGGVFEFEVGDIAVRHLNIQDRSTVTLYGSDFNFPLFEPVEPLEGVITGTLADGNAIDWVFERHPTATIMLLPYVPGDYNEDGVLSAADVDLQTIAMQSPDPDLFIFDENGDDVVDQADRTIWVYEHAGTYFGDANLDGEFNSGDLVSVFQAGRYETDEAAGWTEGDWSGDGRFGSRDLVVAFQDNGYEQGPQAATIPEPTAATLLLIALFATLARCQRRS